LEHTHTKGKRWGEVNLLEHYIVRIHEGKEFEKYPDMIEVDVTCNCYGSTQRVKHLTDKKQWQIDLKNGYFMA
jgi:hypothetical protein